MQYKEQFKQGTPVGILMMQWYVELTLPNEAHTSSELLL